MTKRQLQAYYLALCAELERETSMDAVDEMSVDVIKSRCKELEERLDDEGVKNAKASIEFWEGFIS